MPPFLDEACTDPAAATILDASALSSATDGPGAESFPTTMDTKEPAEEHTYITHLIHQPAAVNDFSQWAHQAIHSVYASRMPMPEAWQRVPHSSGSRQRSGRRVVLVGVMGPSGVGKSSLCRRLGRALESPFEPIATDWYVRPPADLPRCPHRATDSRLQWSQAKCYEFPWCYDLNGLHDELLLLVRHVAQCKQTELHPYYLQPPRERRPRLLQKTGEVNEDGPTYLFVEGFVLFAEPALVCQLDELVWLDVPLDISAQRRYRRGARLANYEDFCLECRDHIHAAHVSYRGLLERNVQHRYVHRVDASHGASEVFRQVLTCLEGRCFRFQ